MCQAPALDQGSYPLEVVIDGISSDNGAKYHAVAYTTLELVSKPQISARWLAPPLHDARTLAPLGRGLRVRVGTRTVAASVDPASTGISCVAPVGILGSATVVPAARGRGDGHGVTM